MNQISLQSQNFLAGFDPEKGTLRTLRMTGDELGTEFIGSEANISYPSILKSGQRLGDWKIVLWDKDADSWKEELTSRSGDIRRVHEDENAVTVSYRGRSSAPGGISDFELEQRFEVDGEVMRWTAKLTNPKDVPVEFGEVSLPFLTNTDFNGIFTDEKYRDKENWHGVKQRLWHEQRVQQHLCITGNSSYASLQRPKGDYPGLLFQVADDTALEVAYQMDPGIGDQFSIVFEGPYYLSLYSWAAVSRGGWNAAGESNRYWFNGNTSLVLGPGMSKEFHFVFSRIDREADIARRLYQYGQAAVDVQPGMVAPCGEEVNLRVRAKDAVHLVPAANNLNIDFVKREEDDSYYRLSFSQSGQKEIQIHHGGKRTNLFFYAIENPGVLLRRHADFVATRQYYENKEDPFGRHHGFLPYDDRLDTLFVRGSESWQVGCMDEYCMPPAMFLAEKNTYIPNEKEVDVLEGFVDDCLFRHLQDPETFLIRRGLYYETINDSDRDSSKWSRERAESTERSFNYPLVFSFYYSMYKIGKKYGITKRHTALEYLDRAFRTAMVGYEVGRNKFNGAPAGATVVPLLDDLKEERPEQFRQLYGRVRRIAEENAASSYPYGSELYVDQTCHNQYHAMMEYFGFRDKMEEIYRVTYALRGGLQPVWFQYGNEKRGNVCCWYGTPQNTRVLYKGFEETGDQRMAKLGYSGLFSFLTCLRISGAAHGWFLWWPDRTGNDLRSLDTDLGMYNYLYAAKSYLVEDGVFGLVGYGCRVDSADGRVTMTPYDGIGARLYAAPYGIDIEAAAGRVESVSFEPENRQCVIRLSAAGSGVYRGELTVKGPESWDVVVNGKDFGTIGQILHLKNIEMQEI